MDDLPVPAPDDTSLARLSESPVALYLARLTSPLSRATMLSKLNQVARLLTGDEAADAWGLPWQALTPVHLDWLRAALAQQYAPASANCHLSAVRGVLKAAWRAGLLTAEVLAQLNDTEPVRGSRLAPGRSVAAGELGALFAACHDAAHPNRSARDAAALALLYGAGLRRAEAVGLDVSDFDAAEETVLVQRGKGNKARSVPLVVSAGEALRAWLDRRGDEPGALLCPVNKADVIEVRRLTPPALGPVLDRLAKTGGVRDLTCHDLRRSLVGDLLDAGADLATVQQLAGHASPTTTSRYDRRPAEARKRAARLLKVPFEG